uniref:Pherophorin domain-containing protein n=1 Tax=Erythrolobus madagascarensis TaxID=708628 RepID=A0A7S0T622_9RHOD|mmetsp:Transcript_19/g.40  ORF Transcript_19/g.40 Transcript_19/m.40 type:complete len:290 (+) Transcript_19:14-883(+)
MKKFASAVQIGVLCAAVLIAAASAQEECDCDVQFDATCTVLQPLGGDTCAVDTFECEKCFCMIGGPFKCPLVTVDALVLTNETGCGVEEVTYTKCPETFETPSPTPTPNEPFTFSCRYTGVVPAATTCIIPPEALPGPGITAVNLAVVQSVDATVTAVCGLRRGLGDLLFNMENIVSPALWEPAGVFDVTAIPDFDQTVPVVESDNCQGTGDGASEIQIQQFPFTGMQSVSVGASTPAFLATMNANAGMNPVTVDFSFQVNTGVAGDTLLGAGFAGGQTDTEFIFSFVY